MELDYLQTFLSTWLHRAWRLTIARYAIVDLSCLQRVNHYSDCRKVVILGDNVFSEYALESADSY